MISLVDNKCCKGKKLDNTMVGSNYGATWCKL